MNRIKKFFTLAFFASALTCALACTSTQAKAANSTAESVEEISRESETSNKATPANVVDLTENLNTEEISLASGSVDIAHTSSGPFTTRSTPEIICPQMDATLLSLVAYCDDETEDVIFSIWGNGDDNKDFALDIVFKADGHTKTYTYYIPKGEYKANFHSSTQTVKRGTAVLSVEA